MNSTSPLPPGALIAPAVARNREPILAVLRRVAPSPVLPARGLVLEIASGSGEHAVYFAAALPHLTWQPSDPDPEARESITAYRAAAQLPNLLPPLALDAVSPDWPATQTDMIVAINMIHIAPWAAAEGLMAGAERLLPDGGVLFLYGPFRERGQHTAPSNAAFDESLRARNREWGVRDLDDIVALASGHGLALEERVTMPANNLSVVFRRRTS
jgi:SAM-dependent methyltransferase